MIISVTRQHIKRGAKGITRRCPIALALKGAGFLRPYVYSDERGAGFSEMPKGENGAALSSRRLPRSVTRFIKCFDHGAPVRPFRFRLPSTVRPT